MKTFIFNDSHLTHEFNQDLFDYIVKLVKSSDRVIINGDFWDGYLTTFDAFYYSEWQQLFPILKEKNTIYIHGNHDKEEFVDERIHEFSDEQVLRYSFESGDTTYYIEHGHLIAPTYDHYFPIKNDRYIRPFYARLRRLFEYHERLYKMYTFNENIAAYRKFKKFVKMVQKQRDNKSLYIFGHTHLHKAAFDKAVVNVGPLSYQERHFALVDDGKLIIYPEVL